MNAFTTNAIKYTVVGEEGEWITDYNNTLASLTNGIKPRIFDNGFETAKFAKQYVQPTRYGFVCPALIVHDSVSVDTFLTVVEPAKYGSELDPTKAVLIECPHSEVNMHMQVAGKGMLVQLQVNDDGYASAQLFTCDGVKFSGPITTGEAGLRWDETDNRYYTTLASVKIKDLK